MEANFTSSFFSENPQKKLCVTITLKLLFREPHDASQTLQATWKGARSDGLRKGGLVLLLPAVYVTLIYYGKFGK